MLIYTYRSWIKTAFIAIKLIRAVRNVAVENFIQISSAKVISRNLILIVEYLMFFICYIDVDKLQKLN